MIDHTSTRIEQQETALRRQNRRRYAFQRMLEATDRVLGQLEEMNRDGLNSVLPPGRSGGGGTGARRGRGRGERCARAPRPRSPGKGGRGSWSGRGSRPTRK